MLPWTFSRHAQLGGDPGIDPELTREYISYIYNCISHLAGGTGKHYCGKDIWNTLILRPPQSKPDKHEAKRQKCIFLILTFLILYECKLVTDWKLLVLSSQVLTA